MGSLNWVKLLAKAAKPVLADPRNWNASEIWVSERALKVLESKLIGPAVVERDSQIGKAVDGAGARRVPISDQILHIAADLIDDQVALERPGILSLLRLHRGNQGVVVGNESLERAAQLRRIGGERQCHRSRGQRVQQREAHAGNDVGDGVAGLGDWIWNAA